MLSFLLPLVRSERTNTKPIIRSNQVCSRDAPPKKQLTASQPAPSKPSGAGTVRHRDAPTGAKKMTKSTGKAGSSTQSKANTRNTNNTNRGTGKFSWTNHCSLAPACKCEWGKVHHPAPLCHVTTYPLSVFFKSLIQLLWIIIIMHYYFYLLIQR